MTNAGTMVKSTVNLSKYYKEQLEYLVQIKELGSVTEGINLAIENFVKAKQKELYAQQMKAASEDAEFISRTMGTQKAFEKSDADTEKRISAEDCEW